MTCPVRVARATWTRVGGSEVCLDGKELCDLERGSKQFNIREEGRRFGWVTILQVSCIGVARSSLLLGRFAWRLPVSSVVLAGTFEQGAPDAPCLN